MSLMYGDKVRITPVDTDNELKVATEKSEFIMKAHVEDSNIVLTGFSGTVISAYTRVFIPNKKVMRDGKLQTLNIKKGDMLSIIKLHGLIMNESERIPRPIIQIERRGYYHNRHLQVLL